MIKLDWVKFKVNCICYKWFKWTPFHNHVYIYKQVIKPTKRKLDSTWTIEVTDINPLYSSGVEHKLIDVLTKEINS